jgi:hypothetical protein
VPSSNALGVINNTGINNPQTWTLLYQQNVQSCSNNTAQNYSGNMGFPFCNYRTPYLNFLYFQVIFAVPYWGGNALNACMYDPTSNFNENIVYPNNPGYILAFYNRSYPLSQDAPYQPATSGTCGLVTNPYSSYSTSEYEAYGNYYPVIYEATNLANQTNGTLQYNQTLLGFLNNTFGTSSTSLQDFLVSEGWLENVTGSGTGSNTNSAGSSTSTGVNLGAVFNYEGTKTVELGDGWWFAGFLPYNFNAGNQSEYWTPTETTLSGPYGEVIFTEGNVVMASVVPLDASGVPIAYYPASVGSSACTSGCDVSGCEAGCATGNYFWDSITTTYVTSPSGQTFNFYVIIGVGGSIQAPTSYTGGGGSPAIPTSTGTAPAAGIDNTTANLVSGPEYIVSYVVMEFIDQISTSGPFAGVQIYVYQNPFYSNYVINIVYSNYVIGEDYLSASINNYSQSSISVQFQTYNRSGQEYQNFGPYYPIVNNGGGLEIVGVPNNVYWYTTTTGSGYE